MIGILKQYANAAIAIVFAALVLAGGVAYWYHGHQQYKAGRASMQAQYDSLIAQYTQASKQGWEDAKTKEASQTQANAAAATQYAKELDNAKTNADRTIADLRTGAVRLRAEWRNCQATPGVLETPTRGTGADEAAGFRATNAEPVYRAVVGQLRDSSEADAMIRALQAVVKADRQ